jgi:hypothetical protein
VTVPLDAFHAREIEEFVVPVTRAFAGVDGAPGLPPPPPSQPSPLNRQFWTPPEKLPGLPLKPNVVDVPAARVGAQVGLRNVWCWPDAVCWVSQALLIE